MSDEIDWKKLRERTVADAEKTLLGHSKATDRMTEVKRLARCAAGARYRKNHPDLVKARHQKYHATHIKTDRARNKRHYDKNRDVILNRAKCRNACRRYRRLMELDPTLQFPAIWNSSVNWSVEVKRGGTKPK